MDRGEGTPPPGLPLQAGGGATPPSPLHRGRATTPSPACRGGLGWGESLRRTFLLACLLLAPVLAGARPAEVDKVLAAAHAQVGVTRESLEGGTMTIGEESLTADRYRALLGGGDSESASSRELLTPDFENPLPAESDAIETETPAPSVFRYNPNRIHLDLLGSVLGGQGLEGMRGRLEAVGGRLDVRRRIEPPTFTATAWVPLRSKP